MTIGIRQGILCDPQIRWWRKQFLALEDGGHLHISNEEKRYYELRDPLGWTR